MSYGDAVTREAAWFNTANALPALALAQGGLFDIVAAYPRRISQRPRQLYLWRSSAVDKREAMTGQRSWTHRMVAEIIWAAVRPTSEADADLALIDGAVDSVLQRIRGGGDASHGGRFFDQPGPVQVVYGDVPQGLSPTDAPTSAGLAWVVRIAYDLTEYFVT